MNVKYPVTMRNGVVYRESSDEVLSLTVLENRWKLFGHTLRLHEDTPAQKSMKFFFTESKAGRFKGRPRMNLPYKLNEDLQKYTTSGMKLKTSEDLEKLKELAQDRKKWKELTNGIYRTAKAEKNLI